MTQQPVLTPHQIAQLEAPFRLEEHGFVERKGVYIKKSAIRARLTQVDPNWTLSAPQVLIGSDQIVVMTAGLTVGGATRHGVGVGIIHNLDPEGRQPGKQLAEISKAYKTAATDCLPRAAALFGIGEYLRDLDAATKNSLQALARWLNGQGAGSRNAAPAERPQGPRSWLELPNASTALENRLRALDPSLTPAAAEQLVGRPLGGFNGIESAMDAVKLAYERQAAS